MSNTQPHFSQIPVRFMIMSLRVSCLNLNFSLVHCTTQVLYTRAVSVHLNVGYCTYTGCAFQHICQMYSIAFAPTQVGFYKNTVKYLIVVSSKWFFSKCFTHLTVQLLISGERWLAVCHPLAAPRLLTQRVSRIALALVLSAALLSSVPTVFEYRTSSNGDGLPHNSTTNTTFTTISRLNAQPVVTYTVQPKQGSRLMTMQAAQSASSIDTQSIVNLPSNECDSSIGEAGNERTNIGNHPLYKIGYFLYYVLVQVRVYNISTTASCFLK